MPTTYPKMNAEIVNLLRLTENNHVATYAAARIEELETLSADLLAACERLSRKGVCDLCYEDPCDPTWCECSCHGQDDVLQEEAAVLISKSRAALEGVDADVLERSKHD